MNNVVIRNVALLQLKGIGPAFVKRIPNDDLLKNVHLIQQIKYLTATGGKQFDEDAIKNAIDTAHKIMFTCQERNINILDIQNDDYPPLLRELKDAPPLLYCKGNMALLKQKTLCIIGTREPNENGIKIAERASSYFNNLGWCICNGLAKGIDEAAIMSNGLIRRNIIGVVAGGLDYDKKTLLKSTTINAERVIEKEGILVSEIPPGKKEDTFSVVKSCRIQAGISNGILIVQSSLDGGSKFSTKAICETNRPIAVINPIKSDFDEQTYSANKELILNQKHGLSKFTDLKITAVQHCNILAISSRHDYSILEQAMTKNKKIYNYLFN
ncbi:DNA-processing protein DprA [Mucilaginibacter sp.]